MKVDESCLVRFFAAAEPAYFVIRIEALPVMVVSPGFMTSISLLSSMLQLPMAMMPMAIETPNSSFFMVLVLLWYVPALFQDAESYP